MLFFSFFKSLVGQDVVVELKNDLSICGTLHSVDQYLNMKLTDISVAEPEKFPQMHAVKNCFIRGSVLFFSFFKSLVGQDVVVELKNDLSICGTLHSVDQYLNMKLTDISVAEPEKFPQMHAVKNCFIRGSVVRYVQLPADRVDTQLLQDASRKEAAAQSRK
ncbi:LSM domain protein [Oesophagostomum dentatum]|uniref:U6 snRNA-associated Sm-like protein LSm2 n=3 Tax=Strongyloidea TaxID=27829 RepID=A0A0B1SP19_OESDE|nr:LSM domain protein [Oesophagostomum dentatum]